MGKTNEQTFRGYELDESGELAGPVTLTKVRKTEAQWRAELTTEQFRIVRGEGTERAFTGALLENEAEGIYRCVACGLPLFDSETKFKSGTGWPSFYESIAKENVAEIVDASLGMTRTEVQCARCDGHLGHVFKDGPRPTGLRYCLNSESLAFTSTEELSTPADREETTVVDDMSSSAPHRAKAVFAGGCFWCVEAVFEELEGVHEAISGYAGGTKETANYQAVCSGRTGHAEAVQIVYDPTVISYEVLLRVHFATHDPTQLNRQGNDVGPQYRSAIFFADEREQALAEAAIEDLNGQKEFSRQIVTTLEPLTVFHRAEYYHQNYVCNNPNQGYVRGIALPKVEKMRERFKDRLKEESPLERSGK